MYAPHQQNQKKYKQPSVEKNHSEHLNAVRNEVTKVPKVYFSELVLMLHDGK